MIIKLEIIIIILISVAYITLFERKFMGSMQRREGPRVVGYKGVIQPIIDGIKLFIKEGIKPEGIERKEYIMGPLIIIILGLIIWGVIPLNKEGYIIEENKYSIIYIIVISTISIYIIIYSGWVSSTIYTYMGGIRAIIQLISYEVSLGVIIITIIYQNKSYNLLKIIYDQIYTKNILTILPILPLLIISIIAETNRPPFDLPEAESELVAGVITEYGGITFGAIYLGEYIFILSMSILSSILLFGEIYLSIFIIIIFIWVRTALPRIRNDQLVELGWNKILPLTLSYLLYTLFLINLF